MGDPLEEKSATLTKLQSLREIMDERDKRYEDRFVAMDAKTSLALSSSEKAISKAETATEKRFDSVNEFRGTLNDQASKLLPRAEADSRFLSHDEKIEDLKKQIAGLRESRSSGEAKETANHYSMTTVFSVLAVLIAIAALIMRMFGK